MASKGQLLMAQAIRKDNKKRKDQTRESEEQMGKRSGWGGWGRTLLGLAGGMAGATVGMPWLGAGLGSMAGNKIGQTLAGGVDKIDDTDFGVTATEDINREIGNYGRKENEMVVGRGIRDAFGAYVAPQMFEKGAKYFGAKFGNAGLPASPITPELQSITSPNISMPNSEIGTNFKPSITDEKLSEMMQARNNSNLTSVNNASPSGYNYETGGGTTAIESTATPSNNLPIKSNKYSNDFLNSITNNEYTNNTPLSQAINNNGSKASPYIQNTGKYISPEAKRQMMLRGLLSKSQSGGQYGS
jgi:hypothetical protein|tara:strand:+ start:732 stop:1634 length:903 start_codon:yes stop_codon:yes gene_type:complete